MTIKLIQHAAVVNNDSLIIAPSGSGSLIVVMIINLSTTTVSSVTDNAPGGSSRYVQIPNARSVDVAGIACDIWYTANSHQKTTSITVTLGAGSVNVIFMFEVEIMNSSSPFQEIGLVNDGVATTTIVGASVATSNALDFIASVALASTGDISNISAGNAFTLGDIANGNASAYLITKHNGTYAPSFDSSLSTFCSSTASFREAPHSIDVRGILNKQKTRADYYEG
jgi:hypothetical protein